MALDPRVVALLDRMERFALFKDPAIVHNDNARVELERLARWPQNRQDLAAVLQVTGWVSWCCYLAAPNRHDLIVMLVTFQSLKADGFKDIPVAIDRVIDAAANAELLNQLDIAAREDNSWLVEEICVLIEEGIREDLNDLPKDAEILYEVAKHFADHAKRGDQNARAEFGRLLTSALNRTPAEHAAYQPALAMFARNAVRLYDETRSDIHLRQAISASRAAAAGASTNPERLNWLQVSADHLLEWYGLHEELDVVDECIGQYRHAIDLCRLLHATGDYDAQERHLLSALAVALKGRYSHSGDQDVLAEAIAVAQDSIRGAPSNTPATVVAQAHLGVLLRNRFEHTAKVADLRAAERLLVPQREATPSAVYCSELAFVLKSLYEATGEVDALERAIKWSGRAVEVNGSNSFALSIAAQTLKTEFERTDAIDVLSAALELARRALHHADNAGDQRGAQTTLGSLLRLRFDALTNPADLDAAISALKQVLESSEPDGVARATNSVSLANALTARYIFTGDPAELDLALDHYRDAVSTAKTRATLSIAYSAMTSAYSLRHDATGSVTDLDDAEAACRHALETLPEEGIARTRVMWTLGMNALSRYDRTQDPEFLEQAISLLTEGTAVVDNAHNTTAVFVNLANAHVDRSILRTSADPAKLEDLTQAEEIMSRAVDRLPTDSSLHPFVTFTLGRILLCRYRITDDVSYLRQAVDHHREANSKIPANHHMKVGMLNGLATVLAALPDKSCHDDAFAAFRAAGEAIGGATSMRVQSYGAAGELAVEAGDFKTAAELLANAVKLLPRLATRQSDGSDARYWLSRFSGLASDAAACALAAGDIDQAVTVLELGRGIILSQENALRSDLGAVREREPAMAGRFEHLARIIQVRPKDALFLDADTETARLAEIELERLISEIRTRPGLDRFLLPPTAAELRREAHAGPIVLINVSRFRSDALLITSAEVLVVGLPDLTFEAVSQQVFAFMTGIEDTFSRNGDDEERKEAYEKGAHAVLDVLAWLWDHVTGPILSKLGITEPASDTAPPRLWWIPCGALAVLPLHAAGHHADDQAPHRRTVLDRVVSSYTPTVRALTHTRQQRPTGPARTRPLVVAASAVEDAPELLGARLEASTVAARLPGALLLEDKDATREAVLAKLPNSSSVHFACHGSPNWTDQAASALLLVGGRLTVRDIVQAKPAHAELAYLSACRTSSTVPQLVDESVHITGAFQLAGFQHVIGTLWQVSDLAALQVGDLVYEHLTRGTDGLKCERSAVALHEAIKIVRSYLHPAFWAAHVHVGP